MGTVMNDQNFRRQQDQLMMNIWARKLLDQMEPSVLFTKFSAPSKPLTRMEKIRRRLSIYGERISNAWAALRGIDYQ